MAGAARLVVNVTARDRWESRRGSGRWLDEIARRCSDRHAGAAAGAVCLPGRAHDALETIGAGSSGGRGQRRTASTTTFSPSKNRPVEAVDVLPAPQYLGVDDQRNIQAQRLRQDFGRWVQQVGREQEAGSSPGQNRHEAAPRKRWREANFRWMGSRWLARRSPAPEVANPDICAGCTAPRATSVSPRASRAPRRRHRRSRTRSRARGSTAPAASRVAATWCGSVKSE